MAGASRQSAGRGPLDELKLSKHLQTNEAVKGIVRFDTFTGKPMLQRPVPRPLQEVPRGFQCRPWHDTDTTSMMEHLIDCKFKKVKRTTVDHGMMLEAHTFSYSSAVERFEALPKWDGRPRLDDFLIEVLGLTDQTKFAYYRNVSRCFFKAIVARVFRPGCKVDTVLVLEGPQGIFKSKLLRIFALDDDWFSDSLPHNVSSKDAKQHLLGKLVIEMSEIAQMDRSTNEALKAFLSAQDDKFRPPYARHEVTCLRQCVFVGTTNDDQYLKDITGNRRYWPIACGALDLDYAEANIEMVYAEARMKFRHDPVWWFQNGEEEAAQVEQARRLHADPWEEIARGELAKRERTAAANNEIEFDVVVADVLFDWFKIPIEKQDGKVLDRVGKLLKSLGGLGMRSRIDGIQKRVRRFKIGDVGRGGDAESTGS